MFHLPCPTCGATTSFAHFVRGDWRPAFQANPAGFVLAVLSSFLVPWLSLSAASGRLTGLVRAERAALIAVIALGTLTLVTWMLRLLPALH